MQRPDIPDDLPVRPRPAAGAASAPKPAATPAPAPKPASAPEQLVADWYVGISGEPVGPIDINYIKSQVEAGKVTGDSLVWREELTDWKPLHNFDELRGLVPPAAASDPVALTRVKEQDSGSSAVAALLAAGGADAAPGSTAPPSATPADARISEPPPSSMAPDSVAIERAAGLPERRRRKRGMHPMAYAFIAMAAAFGAVAAFVLLTSETSTGETPDASGTAAASGATTGVANTDPGGAPSSTGTAIELAQVDVAETSSGGNTRASSGGSAKSGAKKGTDPPKPEPCRPDDPFCDKGPSGPSAAKGTNGGNGAGQGLTQGQVQGVVNRNRRAVSRKCMGYVTGKKGGSAKVFVSMTVGASGAVQSVSASGGKGFPGLASCVRSRVANWSFPSAGATTKVNVPFHFLSQ